MNKKGYIFGKWIDLILALILLLVMASSIFKPFGMFTNFGVKQEALKDADFDNDDIPEWNDMDKSPCVADGGLIEIAGVYEYYYDNAIDTDGDGELDCKDAELAARGVTLTLMIDTSTGQDRAVCIYPRDRCDEQLEEYHDELIEKVLAARKARNS